MSTDGGAVGTKSYTTADPVLRDHRSGATRRQWVGLWILALGLGLVVLDGTIVAVSMPIIVTDLGLNIADAQWITSLYSVVFAALLLSMGRLGDATGRRRLMLIGVATFVAGSVMAALSSSIGPLLVSRVVQGIGGSMVLPSTLSTVNATFRGRDRAAAFGVWGAVMSGSAALGPLVGGAITQFLQWPWIFWVNVPLGLMVFVGALVYVDETRSNEGGGGADPIGAVMSALGFGAIVFGLIEANSLGWWTPTGTLVLGSLTWGPAAPVSAVPVAIGAGAVILVGFVVWQKHRQKVGKPALLDLSLFRLRTFTLGNITAGLVAIGEFSLLFVLPLYLVSGLGLSPLSSGAVLASMAAGAFLSGAAARHLAVRMGATRVVLLGLGLEIVGTLMTALALHQQWAGPWVALVLVPYGVGLGLASAQLTSTILHDVPADESGIGSATQSTVRQLGTALGSTIGGSVLAAALGLSLTGAGTGIGIDASAGAAAACASAVLTSAMVLALGLLMAWGVDRAAKAS
ncbi:MFS transporter [Actinomycetaceae bacterium MB13-C1-2]|nr:MFS transporter [Actinomycetaceae bacterium MB13-C1-2]